MLFRSTEAEWEYAATGGATCQEFKYAGSNCSDSVGWVECSVKQTQPVGQKRANALGIYDMSGNVWEWCSDWYDSDYYSNSPFYNPQGGKQPNRPKWIYKVKRGSSWDHFYYGVRNRRMEIPEKKSNSIGFRLVQDIK